MTDPDSTTSIHYLILLKDLHAWMRMLMQESGTGASGLMELGKELKWLSQRAGVKA